MVIKRNGEKVKFNENKIYEAIMKAMKFGSGIVKEDVAYEIAYEIKERYLCGDLDASTVKGIESIVYELLIHKGQTMTAKAYEGYRAVQEFKKVLHPLDESVLGLINLTNEEVMTENSNKQATLACTQRDLIAGEVSKHLAKTRLIPAHIIQANEEGIIKLHDLDYYASPITNCELVNLEDMLQNGTVINKKMIEKPKSLRTASTVATQIAAQVSSSTYGLI